MRESLRESSPDDGLFIARRRGMTLLREALYALQASFGCPGSAGGHNDVRRYYDT